VVCGELPEHAPKWMSVVELVVTVGDQDERGDDLDLTTE
jgi:hypothetical protein